MLSLSFNAVVAKTILIALVSFGLHDTGSKVGVDRFEIYLNDQLLIRESLLQPLHLRDIVLAKADAKDVLSIKYRQCNAPGKAKGRSISLRDDQGNIIKKWTFEDESNEFVAMKIPVGELMEIQKNTPLTLRLYYAAENLEKGQVLAALPIAGKGKS